MGNEKANPFSAAAPGPGGGARIRNAGRFFRPHILAALTLFLLSSIFWSCNTTSPADVYTVTFKLDSARVGKFDSIMVQIYNGAVPGPGDTNQVVQREVIKVGPATKEITVQLDPKVGKDFSVIITGFSGNEIAYRNLHEVNGFTAPDSSKPAVLLVSRIQAADLLLSVGETRAPVLTFTPDNAGDKRFLLTSKDSTVAVVGDSLKGVKIGNAKVTVSTRDLAISADFSVSVQAKVFHVDSVKAAGLRGLPGDTLAPGLTWSPANATDQGFTLKPLDTAVAIATGGRLALKAIGTTKVEVSASDGGKRDTFELAVELANFKADILPITSSKCAPCHIPPATFNWTDSAQLVNKGSVAIDRLTRPDTAVGKMPLAGAAGGPIGKRDLNVLLGWLARVAIPLQSIAIADSVVNLGDTVVPNLIFTPANAVNQAHTLTVADSGVAVVRGNALVPVNIGVTNVDVITEEGAFTAKFKLTVQAPLFQKDILPITSVKCFPCHGPGTTFNWQDSVSLISDGSNALDRLQRDIDAPGRMPLKVGAPNGDLTPAQLHVLLTWLNTKVVPLKGIAVANDSVMIGSEKAPAITFTPANATNKAYELISSDSNTARVDGGEFFGKALGSTTLLVRAFDGNYSKQITVKVIPVPVDSITADDSAGAVGDTVIPKVNFFPANASDQTYKIALLKASAIIKLDTARKAVIGLAVGKDTLEATSNDGSKKARIAFTVGPVLAKSLAVPDTNGTGSDLVTPRLIWTPATTTNKAYTLSIPPADTLVAAVRGGQILCKSVGIVAVVTAASTADPTVQATFKFTVGAVSVQSLSAPASVVVWNTNFSPAVTILPANATNKNFVLRVTAADAANLAAVSATTLFATHLVSTNVVIKALGDSSKTSNWPVTVVRTPFTGAVKNLIASRCIQCHFPGNGSGLPNWQDSATVVNPNLGQAETNPQKIIRRIQDTVSPMPPTYAGTPGPLGAADIQTLTTWLSEN